MPAPFMSLFSNMADASSKGLASGNRNHTGRSHGLRPDTNGSSDWIAMSFPAKNYANICAAFANCPSPTPIFLDTRASGHTGTERKLQRSTGLIIASFCFIVKECAYLEWLSRYRSQTAVSSLFGWFFIISLMAKDTEFGKFSFEHMRLGGRGPSPFPYLRPLSISRIGGGKRQPGQPAGPVFENVPSEKLSFASC